MNKYLNRANFPNYLVIAISLLIFQEFRLSAQVTLPVPDHIVVAFLENHAYSQIIGSDAAPYLNSLATDPNSALFSHSFALEHPSQPNYLDFYSGCNQGVTDDNFPSENPFTTENIGRQLIDLGMNFTTYSEDLPNEGFNGTSSGPYVRKHNPAANWMGTGTNQIPSSTNQPLTAFPSSDFTQLPEVCFVVPNQNNNMHDGVDPERITQADTWVQNNLSSYIEWSRTHNSLFILTFDEDNYSESNRIVTIFAGEMVKTGEYTDTINHYSVLRTIEDMYGLPYACNAANVDPISSCWNITGINDHFGEGDLQFQISPNPNSGNFNIQLKESPFYQKVQVEIYTMAGLKIIDKKLPLKEIKIEAIPSGIYVVELSIGFQKSFNKVIVF